MRPLVQFFRANPQAFVLLVICLVLGLGTFLPWDVGKAVLAAVLAVRLRSAALRGSVA